MWTFDQNKYLNEILIPAVAEFTKSGELPDAFARYSLKPDVSDLGDIQKATKEVLSFWNKSKNNPRQEKLLKVLIAENREIVQELSDEKAREALRGVVKEEQKKKQEKRFGELDNLVKTVAGRGFLTPEEADKLIKTFTAKGLTEEEIRDRIKIPIKEREVVSPPEKGLEEGTRTRIRNNLATLGKTNLYEFLDIRPGASKAELEKRYQELTAEWNKRINDNKKTSAQALLAIVKDTLIRDGLEKYEKALVWIVIDDELNTQVEFAASDQRISRQEFEALVSHGIKFGLSQEQATEAILWLAYEKKAVVEQNEKIVDLIVCAGCRHSIPKEHNKCTNCGEDLWVFCPKCTTKIAASETACGKCGFVTADRYRVNLLIRKVHFALEEKQLDNALKFAREAERLWGRTDDLAIILNKVEQLFNQAKSCRKDYDEALVKKELLTARDRLEMLIGISPHYQGWDGKTPSVLQQDLESQFQKIQKLLEKARQTERENKTDELIRIYQEIQNIAVDFEEVQNGFKRFPPQPPSNVVAKVYDNGVVIKWDESPSAGQLEYVVVRGENRPPATESDGEVMSKIPNNSFNDESVRPGSFVYYGIFTERGGAFSSGIVSQGVLAIKEVEDFVLEANEGMVQGRWKFSVAEGKLRVLCGTESELRKGVGREIQLTNPHSFTDNNLINDKTYSYRVFVEYLNPAGGIITTTGQFRSAIPTIPPQAIERLEIRSENDELHFQWSPPPFGKVSIYRLPQKPQWKSGTKISLTALGSLGTPLLYKGEGLAIDSTMSKNRIYYTPVTIAGESIIVGQTKSFIPAEEVSGLVVEDFGSYLLLRWKWSGSFQAVIVAWRHDEYPIDADDQKAVKQKITRSEYDLNGGFRIPSPKKSAYKFVVYTITENEGEIIHSVGLKPDCRAEIRTLSSVKVTYSLRTKGWWKWKRFVLSLNSEDNVPLLPELLVIVKPGEMQPLDVKSGKVVARIENASIAPSLPFEYEFAMPNIRRPFFVRLFFAAPNSYQVYQLFDPPPKQLKIK